MTRTRSAIVLKDLNVAGMMKNRHLAQAIADVGLYEFRRQLQYKGARYGCQIKLANRFYSSTGCRSGCAQLRKIELNEQI